MPSCRSVALLLSFLVSPGVAAGSNTRVFPSDDTYVTSTAPDAPVGAEASVLKAGPTERIFLRFRVPTPSEGTIESATLRGHFHYASSDPAPFSVFRTLDDDWSEAGLTWNDQPAVDPAALVEIDASMLFVDLVDMDLTAAVRAEQAGDGVLGLRIAPAMEGSVGLLEFVAPPGHGAFHLDLVVSPAPRVESGDLVDVVVEEDGWTGVVATDTDTGVRRLTAAMVLPNQVADLVRDPIDGALIGIDRRHSAIPMRVLRFEPQTGTPRVLSSSGLLTEAFSSRLAVAPDGALYALGVRNEDGYYESCVIAIDRVTGAQSEVSCGASLASAVDLALDASGALVVVGAEGLVGVDPATGAQTPLVPLGGNPQGVAVGADGRIWIVLATFTGSRQLLRFDPALATLEPVAGLPNDAGRIEAEPGGLLVIASDATSFSDWIGRFDPAQGAFAFRLHDGDSHPGGTVVEADGSWTTAWNAQAGVRVSRIDPAAPAEQLGHGWLGPQVYGWHPYRAVFDARRQLVVLAASGAGGGRLVRVDPVSGRQRLLAVVSRLGVDPSPPILTATAHAIGPDGRIIVAIFDHDTAATRFHEVGAEGALAALPAELPEWIIGLQVLPGGDLVATDGTLLLRVDRETGAVERSDLGAPVARFFVEPSGAMLVVGVERLWRLDSDGVLVWEHVWPAPLFLHEFRDLVVDRARGRGWVLTHRGAEHFDLATGTVDSLPLAGLAIANAACSDGFDNTGNGLVDWPDDPHCASAFDETEGTSCGLGAELAPIAWLLSRRRQRRFAARAPITREPL